jgi:hypothetical protein
MFAFPLIPSHIARTGVDSASPAMVKPATVLDWHRQGFKLFWGWKSRKRGPGRPRISAEVRKLIVEMAEMNPDRAFLPPASACLTSPRYSDMVQIRGLNAFLSRRPHCLRAPTPSA